MTNKAKLLVLTLMVYGIPIFLWSYLPFTKNSWGGFNSSTIFTLLLYKKIIFTSMGVIFDVFFLYCIYLLFKKESPIEHQRVYLIASGVQKIFHWIFKKNMRDSSHITKEEKVSLLFYLVKLYFTPVMIGFLIGNTASLLNSLHNITSLYKYNALVMTKANFVSLYLPFVFYIILVLDTLIFSFGYLFESSGLKNVVKSVEPTALGWFVAIICYPPINSVSGSVLGWYSSDFSDFGNINLNIITGVMSVLLFSIYVWASVALWTKASNLTNRGIICKGPYKYVRHPAYISKNLGWWVMGIPFIIANGPIAIFGLTAWSVIYFLRALTEERHLLQDPDYVEYCKKVKYMFIPGIY